MPRIKNLKLPGARKNILLAPHTSFRIGGPARYFYETKTSDGLLRAVKVAEEENIPYFILGGGTNILVSDRGFDGIVIFANNHTMKFDEEFVYVGAGATVQKLVMESFEKGLSGIEFMVGIPGSVGGAIRGNAGAYGKALGDFGDVVQKVTVYKDGKSQKMSQKDMRFSYRTSIVKTEGGLIVDAMLKLERKDKAQIKEVMDKNLEYRNKKTPHDVLSAGSVFKNIEMNKVKLDIPRILKALDVTQDEFDEVTKYRKLPVSFINDRLRLKGKTFGKAQISKLHGGYIINLGGATAVEVIALITFIKTTVWSALGISLEEEIQYVGF